jgi:hypothetical protein
MFGGFFDSTLGQIVQVGLSVFPPTAPFAVPAFAAMNGMQALANGDYLGAFTSIASGVAGAGNLGGLSQTAMNNLDKVRIASQIGSGIQAIESGNILGAAAAGSAAAGGLGVSGLGDVTDALNTANAGYQLAQGDGAIT